ncbi:unnamed protein product [Rhizoctonia solani]|uniref:Uncharacterized protein n=1 Tax=Rhizoctonia solani TaxID=456999 RepID=A0A8H3CW72_9AGAM|nr:unnamed protein product [Rhizoctonia solani]
MVPCIRRAFDDLHRLYSIILPLLCSSVVSILTLGASNVLRTRSGDRTERVAARCQDNSSSLRNTSWLYAPDKNLWRSDKNERANQAGGEDPSESGCARKYDANIPNFVGFTRGVFDLDTFKEQLDKVGAHPKEFGERYVAYNPDTFQYIDSAAPVRGARRP